MNALLNGIRQVCSILFPLITFPYVSRILGKEGYGRYSFSQSITSYFILFASLGVHTYAIREGAKIREEAARITTLCSQIFSINICSAFLSFAALLVFLSVSQTIKEYIPYILIESAAILLGVVGTNWINSIYEDYAYLAFQYIAIQVLALIAMFLFVRKPEDLIPYCIISVFASNGGNLINLYHVRRYVKVKWVFHMELKKHIAPLLILFVNSVAVTVYVNSDITMLGFYEADAVVGVYSFASKIYNILKHLINSVIVVSVPRLSYLLHNRKEEYAEYINRIFGMLNFILLPVTAGLFCMSDSIIRIAGGPQYVTGGTVLRILSIATVFAIYASLFTNCVLIANRQENRCLRSTIVSALVNIILNLLLLPELGMVGAAMTTIVAEGMNCLIQIYYAKPYFHWKKLDFKPGISCAAGTAGVLAVCGLSNYLMKDAYLRMLSAVCGSSMVYGILLIIMKNKYAVEMLKLIKSKFQNRN